MHAKKTLLKLKIMQIKNFRFLPVLSTLSSYGKESFTSDLKASVNVALLALPQSMAYALVAGLPIKYGLLGSAVASLTSGILGRTHCITLGPTNATSVLLFGTFASSGLVLKSGMAGSEALLMLPWIVFLSSLFLLLASILRISYMIQFISRTVITAYITAAAFLIIANQSKHVLGLESSGEFIPSTFLEIFSVTITSLGNTSLPALSLSLITAFVFLLLQRRIRTFPNVAISLLIASLFGFLFQSKGWTLSYLSSFESNLSLFSLPNLLSLENHFESILWSSFAIALLCLLEGLSIGKSLSARTGDRIDADRETFSIGFANLGCSFMSGMPASGSLTRSSLNVNSGAKTSLSNFYTGILILAGYLMVGDLVSLIPLPALATLVIFIGASLIKGRQITTVSKATRADAITFSITLLVGLLISLQVAIFIGVATSLLLLLKKVAEPELVEQGYNQAGELAEISKDAKRPVPEVSIVHVEGVLFFAAADLFYEQIRRVGDDENLRVLVLKLLHAHHLDATSVLALEELLDYLKEKNCHVLLCEVRKDVLRILKDSGVLTRMNRKNIFPHSLTNPTLSTANAIKRAKELVSGMEAKVTIYSETVGSKK